MSTRELSRRAWLAGLGTSALAAAARPRAQTDKSADRWPQFRGTQRLTGVAAAPLPANLTLRWSYETGDVVDSSAAIVDGLAFIGAGDGQLTALDLQSGKPRWKYAAGTLIGESSPAVSGGTVYVGDMDGIVHAVSASTGTRLWTFKTNGEIKASPVVLGDLVLIGSYDTNLYALDARTGRRRWALATKGPVHATVATLAPLVFIAGCDAVFRAVRIANGTQAYEINIGAYVGASPVVEGTRAYFGTYENEVVALDLARRRVLWRYSDPARQFPFYSSAALDQGRVIIGGRDKYVYSLDTATGKPAWSFGTRARVDSSPVVAGGRVYVGSSDGTLYGLDERTGSRLWTFDAGDAITASPAIAEGRLVVGARNGVVYCFG